MAQVTFLNPDAIQDGSITAAKLADTAISGQTIHNAGDTYTDTLPDGVTTDHPFNIETKTLGV